MMDHQLKIDKNGFETESHRDISFPFRGSRVKISKYIDNRFVGHWHYEPEFTLIESGKLYYQTADTVYEMEKGDIVFVNSGIMHSAWSEDSKECEYMPFSFSVSMVSGEKKSAIDQKYVSEIIRNENFPSLLLRPTDPEYNEFLTLLLRSYEAYEKRDDCFELRVKSDVCLLWSVLYRAYKRKKDEIGFSEPGRRSTYVQKALEFISEHYTDKISLSDIAQHCGLSTSELCRTFKKTMQQTPFEYLLRYRANQSLTLLMDRSNNITEVALQSGFQNSSYYCRIFKQYMGMPPSKYIKKMQKKE